MSNQIGRRDFMKLAGVLGVSAIGKIQPFRLKAVAQIPPPKKKLLEGQKINTICVYCATGCGVVATVFDGQVVDIEGDPENPINEGAMCSKGNAQPQLYLQNNLRRPDEIRGPLGRLTTPLRRTNKNKGENEDPEWEAITWDQAWTEIIQNTRENVNAFYATNPLPDTDGNYVINGRNFPIAWLGSAWSNNEENYLFRKFMTMLGSNNIDHQARRCHSTTVKGLGATFGFGAMTNHPRDIANAKTIIVLCNPAEQHPCIWQWITKAMDRGAKLIVMEPRYTRSSSRAHVHAWFRPGTDTAVFLGLMNYAITHNLIDEKYLENRTNWEEAYPGITLVADELIKVAADYTPEEVSKITGIPKAKFIEIAEIYCSTRPGTVIYAMGSTQHTNGTQNIRSFAILQLLLGNVGVPGGGVNALRGISNVQGSTDMATMSHILPGYRRVPTNVDDIRNFQKYKNMVEAGQTKQEIADAFSLQPIDLRHWATWRIYTPASTQNDWGIFAGTYPGTNPDNETVISDLPLTNGRTSVEIFRGILEGAVKMLFVVGENPAVSNPNIGEVRRALATSGLFTVVMDLFETEVAHFADIVLPAASILEKDGSVTSTGRWIQWRNITQDPPGDAKADLWFVNNLFKKLRQEGILVLPSERFASDTGNDLGTDPDTAWQYGSRPDPEEVLREINSAVAIYAGVMDATGANLSKRRDRTQYDADDVAYGNFKNWAYSWPDNQRVLYRTDETGLREERQIGNKFFTATNKANVYNPASDFAGRGYGVPTHNEPAESPDLDLQKKYPPLIGDHPAVPDGHINKNLVIGNPKDYPIIFTTFRLTEHMHAGALTRNLPWLVELMPDVFVEMSPTLAESLGVESGDMVRIKSARKTDGIVAKAFITNRIRPYVINGISREVVAMPWHWGFKGMKTGDSANFLTIDAGDIWTSMPETKVCLVSVEKEEV